MEICQRMGWSLEQWYDLSNGERLDWEAWDFRRQQQLTRLLEQIQYDETNDAGEVKHYVRDYGTYISILRELWRCA